MNQAYFEPAKRGEIQLSKPAPADNNLGWRIILFESQIAREALPLANSRALAHTKPGAFALALAVSLSGSLGGGLRCGGCGFALFGRPNCQKNCAAKADYYK